MSPSKEYVGWHQVEFAVRAIAKLVKPRVEKGELVNIYGPPRGGLCPAVMLSHATGLPLTFEPGLKTLIIDDIADTGKTLEEILSKRIPGYMLYNGVAENVFTIYYHKQSSIKPERYFFEKKNAWIVFPWECE